MSLNCLYSDIFKLQQNINLLRFQTKKKKGYLSYNKLTLYHYSFAADIYMHNAHTLQEDQAATQGHSQCDIRYAEK